MTRCAVVCITEDGKFLKLEEGKHHNVPEKVLREHFAGANRYGNDPLSTTLAGMPQYQRPWWWCMGQIKGTSCCGSQTVISARTATCRITNWHDIFALLAMAPWTVFHVFHPNKVMNAYDWDGKPVPGNGAREFEEAIRSYNEIEKKYGFGTRVEFQKLGDHEFIVSADIYDTDAYLKYLRYGQKSVI